MSETERAVTLAGCVWGRSTRPATTRRSPKLNSMTNAADDLDRVMVPSRCNERLGFERIRTFRIYRKRP